MAQLVLVRHGQSEWNALDKWQGVTDTALTSQGESEAARMADLIRDVKIDCVYTSALVRAKKTQEINESIFFNQILKCICEFK